MAACIEPESGSEASSTATLALQGYIGGEWVDLFAETLTLPTSPTALGQSYTISFSGDVDLALDPALTCELRLVIQHRHIAWTPNNMGNRLIASIGLTDFRIEGEDTEDACTGSSGTGGEEPTDPGSEGGDSCGCGDWRGRAPGSCTWGQGATPGGDWKGRVC